MKSLWPCVLAAVLSTAVGCVEHRTEPTHPLRQGLSLVCHDDEASMEMAKLLGEALRMEFSRVQAAIPIHTGSVPTISDLSGHLAGAKDVVLVLVGFPLQATTPENAEVERAIHALDRKGVRVYTVLADLPNTRRRAFFGLPARSTDYRALARLAARQIVESVVFRRDIKIVQILDPSTGGARP